VRVVLGAEGKGGKLSDISLTANASATIADPDVHVGAPLGILNQLVPTIVTVLASNWKLEKTATLFQVSELFAGVGEKTLVDSCALFQQRGDVLLVVTGHDSS